MNAGGRTVYEGGRTAYEGNKTPMQYNTPSYYPNGQKWAGNNSPGFGTEYAGKMSFSSVEFCFTENCPG